MLPTDPKKAQKMGQEWGEVLTDSIFGVTDLIKNRKQLKAQADAKVHAKNQITTARNKVASAQNILTQMALEQQAKEEEARMIANLSPAEREQYYKMKAEEAKRIKAEKLAAEKAERERKELIQGIIALVVMTPMVIYVFMFIVAIMLYASDRAMYRVFAPFVPGIRSILGSY
jgi:hypothetical protein